jgi:hypothetical protein
VAARVPTNSNAEASGRVTVEFYSSVRSLSRVVRRLLTPVIRRGRPTLMPTCGEAALTPPLARCSFSDWLRCAFPEATDEQSVALRAIETHSVNRGFAFGRVDNLAYAQHGYAVGYC